MKCKFYVSLQPTEFASQAAKEALSQLTRILFLCTHCKHEFCWSCLARFDGPTGIYELGLEGHRLYCRPAAEEDDDGAARTAALDNDIEWVFKLFVSVCVVMCFAKGLSAILGLT